MQALFRFKVPLFYEMVLQPVKTNKHLAEKRAEIFGANFITEYMLYSFPFPFPLLPVYYIPGHFYPMLSHDVKLLSKKLPIGLH